MKLHVLAIGAHPDDVELGCTGTLINHIRKGQKAGILDLTAGELGSRGTAETRHTEAQASATLMGLAMRTNLGMADGFFTNDREHLLQIIRILRRYQPELVLANALADRHPDHGRAGRLIADACFYSGLRKVETEWEGEAQKPWRPKKVFHYIQDRFAEPDLIVDITDSFALRWRLSPALKHSSLTIIPAIPKPISPRPDSWIRSGTGPVNWVIVLGCSMQKAFMWRAISALAIWTSWYIQGWYNQAYAMQTAHTRMLCAPSALQSICFGS